MSRILIATLGESPIVVTSLVNLLRQGVPDQNLAPVELDQVILLYPEQHPQIQYGIELIQAHCHCPCIMLEGLPFEDTRSEEDCLVFLLRLKHLLDQTLYHHDTVYLSLAGGRKSMSALMGLLSFFYQHIQGVFHILDRNEDDPNNRNFHPLETLIYHLAEQDPKLPKIMNPLADALELVQLPYGYFADAADLRVWLQRQDPDEEIPTHLEWIPEESRDFWEAIFQTTTKPFYRICLSSNAYKQIARRTQQFSRYFTLSKLRNPQWAHKQCKKGSCGSHLIWKGADKTPFNIAKSGGAERILWYQKDEQTVVCAELIIEDRKQKHHTKYIRVDSGTNIDDAFCATKAAADYPATYPAPSVSSSDDAILIAPVGKSPMVVTQAYTLLERAGVKISRVALVYPKKNGSIKNGVRLLEEVFGDRGMTVEKYPVDLKDVDSTAACKTFLQAIVKAIADLRRKFPDSDLRMLLSGGRKGMSALTLLAAQQAHIPYAYHTLICDTALEDRIEDECSIAQLRSLPGTPQRAERLFVECYPQEQFVLFSIPVIPLRPLTACDTP